MTAATAATIDSGPAAQPAPLAERLRAISPERAALTTRLLAAGDVLVRASGDTQLELRSNVAQQTPHTTTVELSHAHGRIQLVLGTESAAATIGDRTWHDFPGDARLLAWALAYEELVARLSDLLGTPLLPVHMSEAPGSSDAIWHWIEFRFAQGGRGECAGLIGLDRTTMESVATQADWRRSDGNQHTDRNELPLPCNLFLPAQHLRAVALRGLKAGDVLVLGRREAQLRTLRLRLDSSIASIDSRRAWLAAADAGGISLLRTLSSAELRNDAMTQQELSSEIGSADADIRDAIPIRVELLLDSLSMSLGELERISAGQIINLRQPVENAEVTLRVNGKPIGRGELVSLGDLLGIKITRIGDAIGLQ